MRSDPVQLLTRQVQQQQLFTPARRWAIAAAPGRLDVLGGLGADSGGTVAQMAVPAKVAVAVQLRDEALLIAQSEQIAPPLGQSIVQFSLEGAGIGQEEGPGGRAGLGAIASGSRAWALPLLAMGAELLTGTAGGGLGEAIRSAGKGVQVVVRGDVPMGAGQGSSTAMLVAFVLALQELTGVRIEPTESALLVQRAEVAAGTGAAAGGGTGHLLDAMTSLMAAGGAPGGSGGLRTGAGVGGGMLRYSTQPYRFVGVVPVPADVRVLAMDTGVRYTSAHETLEELRIAGLMGQRIIETIYRDLGQAHTPLHGYLANTSPLLYRQYFRALLPRRMRAQDFVRTYGSLAALEGGTDGSGAAAGRMYRVRTAVDHLMAEHEHAEQFLQAMEELADLPAEGEAPPVAAGGEEEDGLSERQKILQRAGRLALASHHSYRLRLELSCREADWLVDRLMEAGPERGIYGARITGCGGGGTVMALADRSAAASDAILEVMKAYTQVTGLSLGVSEAGAAG